MDTSKNYIKMRKAAVPDIGSGAAIAPGSMRKCDRDVYMDTKGDIYYYGEDSHSDCQLERQDQLQAMVYTDSSWTKIQLFGNWLHEYTDLSKIINWSMEQLWLAFVMKERHNKAWSGTEWLVQ